MVKSIYVPEAGGILNFADDVTPEQARAYIDKNYPRGTGGVASLQPESDNSSFLDRAAYSFGTMFTDIPGGIASLMYPASREDETWGGRFSKYWREQGAKNTNIDLTKTPTTTQNLGSALGSIVGFAVPGGLATKGASALGAGARLAAGVGTGVVAGQGAAVGAEQRSEQIRQQIASGMDISEEKQLAAQRLSALIGTSEAIPLQKFFGPISTILSKVPASKAGIVEKIIQNRLAKVTKAGLEEGAQEVLSGIANDLMEYGVYNPDVEIGQDIWTNAGTGAFAGSLLEGMVQIAAGRKLRGVKQLRKDIETEGQQNAANLRQSEISTAADILAKSGVKGEVEIQPNESPEGFTRYTITTPDGKPIVDMMGEEDARQAIDLHQKNTGVQVKVRTITQPTLAPIRIGNKQFATIEAAQAERDRLRSQVADLRRMGDNLELVSKMAAESKVAPGIVAKRIDDNIKAVSSRLTMFDNYFTLPEEEAPELPKAPPQPPSEPGVVHLLHRDEQGKGEWTRYTTKPPEAEAATETTVAPEEATDYTEEFPTPEEAPVEEVAPEETAPADAVTDEPIGAVEMPVEESRVLPDEIIDTVTTPTEVETPPTRTEKRPSASAENLAALQTELFGKPINIREMTDEQRTLYEAERDRRYPPEDVEVYYSAQPAGQAKARTLKEASALGPAIPKTKEAEEWMKDVYTRLQQRLDNILPDAAKLEFKTMIAGPVGYYTPGQFTAGEPGLKSIIDLSTGILKPGMSVDQAVDALIDTLNHEIIHALKAKGVFRPAEWKMLERAVASTNIKGKSYTYLDKAEAIYTPGGLPISEAYADPNVVVEEAIADMYRDWVKNQRAPVPVRGLLNRITEFFRRIFRVLRDANHEKFFKDIEAGEVGRREAVAADLSKETKFSAAPVATNMAGSQDENGVYVEPFPADASTSSTAYLRTQFKRFKGKGRITDAQWGRALDKAFIDKFGRTYDITDPADYQQIVRSIADEINLQMLQAQSGVGWYDADIQDVFGELSKTFPILKDPADGPTFRQMFTMIAGVMSNGMKAKANVELAAINFAHYLNTGKFSEVHPFTKTGWNQRSNIMGPQIAMLNRMINDPMFAPRPGSNNPRVERLEKFLEFMFSEHSVREINAFRARHGTKSPAKIGKFEEKRLGMYAFGPKFGPFILNLNGLSDETVDSWASRSFYRHMGAGVGADGELVKAPLTNNHREAMKRALRDVAAITNLSSRDIQAVLWFYEKELYNHLGQSIPLEVFSDGAREFVRKYGTGTAGSQQSGTDRERAISRSIKTAGAKTGQNIPRAKRLFSAAPAVGSEEFNRWFKGSKIVNPDGSPKILYHGTDVTNKFDSFSVPSFFTDNAEEAGAYTLWRAANQRQKLLAREKYKAIPGSGGINITRVPYVGIISDIPYEDRGKIYATDEGVVRVNESGNVDVFTGWVTDYESSADDYTIGIKRGDGSANAQRLINDRNESINDRYPPGQGENGRVYPVYLSIKNPIELSPLEANRLGARLNSMTREQALEYIDDLKSKGYDGIVTTSDEATMFVEVADALGGIPKQYIPFSPEQVKSVFNQFTEGTATSPKFSAAPLPTYVQTQNQTLFAPVEKTPFASIAFNHFFGRNLAGKTLNVNGAAVEIKGRTMAGLAARAATVDSAAYLNHLESILNQQNTGNFQRDVADYSASAAISMQRRSSQLHAAMLLRGNIDLDYASPGDILSATAKVVDDQDNLKNVFNILLEPGPVDQNGVQKDKLEIFKTYATAKRGEWLRSTGQTVPREITPQYVSQTVNFTEREYPEVVEAYKMYQRFNKKLLTAAAKSGVITQAELARLTNQMNYYGFIYEAYGEALGPQTAGKLASRFKLRPYTGTVRGGLVNDPMFVILQNTQFWVDSIAKNLAATKAFNVARQVGEARLLGASEKPNEANGEQPDVMFFSENGVVKRFAVKDPLLVTALGSDDRIAVGKFWETLGLPAHILRESVTRDPGFMVRNLMRDTLSAWITSGVDFTPVIGTIKGAKTALRDGASFKALQARGAVGSYDMAMLSTKDLAKLLKQKLPKNVHGITSVEQGSAVVKSLWNRLGAVSEASDAATRIAVYEALKAKGMSDAEATMQAIELLDFTRRGASQTMSILTKIIPFLNARVQGLDVLYQAGRSGIRYATGASRGEKDANIGKKFLLRGGMLMAISVALEMMNEDDEDYKQIDDYVKNGNLLVPLKHFGLEGQFLAFPKPFEAGLLFSTIPQQIYKTTQGDASTRENASLFFSQMTSTFGINPIPQAILPMIEVISNHDFFTGLPLIPEGKARLAPELQYNTSTSQLAMMIGKIPIFYNFDTGKFGGASPIVIDKLIRGYSGPVGSYFSQGVGLAMQDLDIGPERMPTELSNAPVIRSFFVDAKSKNPKVVTQAYELFRVVDEVNRSVSRMKQLGDTEALLAYIDENRDILTYKKTIFKLADSLNKLSAQERRIERDLTMSAEEKVAAQRQLREIRIKVASQVEAINKALGR